MKKIIGHTASTTNLSGRRRFANDDLEVLQSHFSEGFEKLFAGKGAFVISGGAITGTTGAYNIAPALVYLNGNVISFEGVNNYAIVAATKLVEDSAVLSGERMFDLVSEERAGIMQKRCKLTEAAAVGDSIALTSIGFAKTYESVLAELLYPAIYKRASVNILPIGSVQMWAGNLENFDSSGKGKADLDGWALCNGANGTIDLSGRFLVGYDPLNVAYNSLAKKGGTEKVTLTTDNLPRHRHVSDLAAGVGGLIKQSQAGQAKTAVTGDSVNAGTEPNILDAPIQDNIVGADQPHENRPPYYTIAFIQKIAIAGLATVVTPPVIVPPAGCNLINGQILGTWNVTSHKAIAKYFNGIWGVYQKISDSPTTLVPRGSNFILRGDFTPAQTLPAQTCFGYGSTGLEGLYKPADFAVPAGWESYIADDTLHIRPVGSGGSGGGSGTGINESITFEIEVI